MKGSYRKKGEVDPEIMEAVDLAISIAADVNGGCLIAGAAEIKRAATAEFIRLAAEMMLQRRFTRSEAAHVLGISTKELKQAIEATEATDRKEN